MLAQQQQEMKHIEHIDLLLVVLVTGIIEDDFDWTCVEGGCLKAICSLYASLRLRDNRFLRR